MYLNCLEINDLRMPAEVTSEDATKPARLKMDRASLLLLLGACVIFVSNIFINFHVRLSLSKLKA